MKEDLLEKILELKINKIEFESIIMNNILDYGFSMLKLKATIEQEKIKEELCIYTKLIKKNKIKESIFCYWTLLYDEQLKNNSDLENDNFNNKISISELKRGQKYMRSVILNIENNNSDLLKNGTIIHLVELENYIKKYHDNIVYNKWIKNLKNINEYILFIGIV